MKKSNLKWIFNPMSEKEMKLVKGGNDTEVSAVDLNGNEGKPCDGKKEYDDCSFNGKPGTCHYAPFVAGLVCSLS